MKLHVGCGCVKLIGFVNTDIDGFMASRYPELARQNETTLEHYYKHEGSFDTLPIRRPTVIDVVADMENLPYEDGSVQEIVCIQALEHVSPVKAYKTLVHWCGLLENGGTVTISVPDMEEIELWLKNEEQRDFAVRHLYGTKRDKWNYHKSWFTFETLRELLHFSGFMDVTRLPNMHCYPAIVVRATK
jgi:hypothetical protein